MLFRSVVDDLIDLRELIAEDRSELAISKIRKVVRADENDADALELLSIASLKSRQPEEALRAADRAVEIEPERAACWHARARALLALEQFELALRSSDEAYRIDPTNADYLKLRTRILLRSRALPEAKKSAADLSLLRPEEPDGMMFSARADQLMGKLRKAEKTIDQVVTRFPEHAAAAKLQVAITRQRDRVRSALPWWRRPFSRV